MNIQVPHRRASMAVECAADRAVSGSRVRCIAVPAVIEVTTAHGPGRCMPTVAPRRNSAQTDAEPSGQRRLNQRTAQPPRRNPLSNSVSDDCKAVFEPKRVFYQRQGRNKYELVPIHDSR